MQGGDTCPNPISSQVVARFNLFERDPLAPPGGGGREGFSGPRARGA